MKQKRTAWNAGLCRLPLHIDHETELALKARAAKRGIRLGQLVEKMLGNRLDNRENLAR